MFTLIAIQMPFILVEVRDPRTSIHIVGPCQTGSDCAVHRSFVEVKIALVPTYVPLKYGWQAIDVMKRMDLESRTPWYQYTLATVTGLSIIRTFKKENEAIDLFYELEDDNSSAYFSIHSGPFS